MAKKAGQNSEESEDGSMIETGNQMPCTGIAPCVPGMGPSHRTGRKDSDDQNSTELSWNVLWRRKKFHVGKLTLKP